MATKGTKRGRRTTGQTTGQTTGHEDGHEDGHDEYDEEIVVGNMFDEMHEDAYVIVKRRDERTKEMVYLYRLDRDECTDEELQRLSGGGHYVCREKNPNSVGQFVWGRQRTIKIGGAPIEPQLPESMKLHATTGVQPDANGDTPPGERPTTASILDAGLLQLFSAQAEVSKQGQQVMQLLMTKLTTEKKTEWAPVVVALVPLVQSWITRPQEERPDPLAMVTAIATMVKENVTPASDLKSQLEVMNDFMDLKTSMQPEPQDPLSSLAGLLPKIVEIMANDQKSGRKSTAESVNAQLSGGAPFEKAKAAPVIQQMLVKFAPRLVGWASEAKDPDVQAGVLLELVPKKYHGHIRELLGHDNADEQVFAMVPQLRTFEDWSRDFFGALTDYFYPAEDIGGEPLVDDVPTEQVEVTDVTDDEQELLDAEMTRKDQAKADALSPTEPPPFVEVGEVPNGD